MDGRSIEPRKAMWAVAEITGQDADGTPFRVRATLEDTSVSGACIRIPRPLAVGSRISIKWHREQFAAIARNCRSDGRDFLLGVRREATNDATAAIARQAPQPAWSEPIQAESVSGSADVHGLIAAAPLMRPMQAKPPQAAARAAMPTRAIATSPSHPRAELHQDTSPRPERKVMEPKTVFPHFWRRKQDRNKQDGDAPAKSTLTEASVNKSNTQESTPSGPRGELLNYEDIYRAAGIMSPGAGYGIHKVVDMLNSDRLRDLPPDAKRASVLMALDAAGISVDELLTDATRRQNALSSYETAQTKQLEEFEARKGKENSHVEEEMEKIRVHYAQRVQANLDQVAKEKEALKNWQNAMQHETKRITEVIDLCGKQPAPAREGNALAAAAGAQNSSTKPGPSLLTDPARSATTPLSGK